MFCSTNITDGTGNGLLSKVMPYYLAIGVFNAGFSSTVLGTIGRVLGNTFISLANSKSLEILENNIFIPLSIISLVSVIFVLVFYRSLYIDINSTKKKKIK